MKERVHSETEELKVDNRNMFGNCNVNDVECIEKWWPEKLVALLKIHSLQL